MVSLGWGAGASRHGRVPAVVYRSQSPWRRSELLGDPDFASRLLTPARGMPRRAPSPPAKPGGEGSSSWGACRGGLSNSPSRWYLRRARGPFAQSAWVVVGVVAGMVVGVVVRMVGQSAGDA